MDIFSDDLEQVYDIVTKHKLRQTGIEEATLKLMKDWLEQRMCYPSHSMSVLE